MPDTTLSPSRSPLPVPSSRLTALLQEFQLVGLASTTSGGPAPAALERAQFVQQLMYVLYDETKFRLGDRTECESLGKVSDAAQEHWHRMYARLESTPTAEPR